MDLYNYDTVNKILKKYGFTFSKALGQNFLIDQTVCPAMARSLHADKSTGVLEIGPGIGVLTAELCKTAGRVTAVEIDQRLIPVLHETVGHFDNLDLINGDIMKLDLHHLLERQFHGCSCVKVCANLPYYITSPVIMTLLESKIPVSEIVVMVQKEAADRLCARMGDRESGAVTVAVSYYADAQVLFHVGRESFVPSPKVDSAVIRLRLRSRPPVPVTDETFFFRFVRAAFSQRRKTLLNSISNTLGVSKDRLSLFLKEAGLDLNVRAEALTMEQLALLSNLLYSEVNRIEG